MIKLLPNHLFDSRPRRQGQAPLLHELPSYRHRPGVKLVVVESRNRTWDTTYATTTLHQPNYQTFRWPLSRFVLPGRLTSLPYGCSGTKAIILRLAGSVVCINLSRSATRSHHSGLALLDRWTELTALYIRNLILPHPDRTCQQVYQNIYPGCPWRSRCHPKSGLLFARAFLRILGSGFQPYYRQPDATQRSLPTITE